MVRTDPAPVSDRVRHSEYRIRPSEDRIRPSEDRVRPSEVSQAQ